MYQYALLTLGALVGFVGMLLITSPQASLKKLLSLNKTAFIATNPLTSTQCSITDRPEEIYFVSCGGFI
jgi:hypothetical protein